MRRDVLQSRRDRTLLGLGVAFLLLTAVTAFVQKLLHGPYAPPLTTDETIFAGGSLLSILPPLLVLVATYGAVLDERASGAIRFTLGLPVSRATVYVGKYLGRAGIVLGTAAVGFALATAVVLLTYPTVYLGRFLLFGVATLLYAVVWVGFGLSVSGTFGSVTRGVASLVGIFVVFRLGWMGVQTVGLRLADASVYGDAPAWYFLLGRINPVNVYVRVTNELMADPEQYHPLLTHPRDLQIVWISAEFALAVLVVWAVVAPLFGYLRFGRADLD
jgi:ABC-2 type transport system permease protein